MFNLAIIDQQAVKLLRASVVITTLEQCLEELIKNALDAKATNIDIKVDIEKTMIQVCDNGVGIPSDHLLQIAQTHVTSKCHTIKDLYETKTFGYRGEVLAALANMSILQITSKYQDSAETYTAIWKDGCLIEHSIIQGKQKSGTIVTIPSLFCKYPVRRKYNNTSLDSLKYTTILFALIFPQVSFNLINSARNMIILTTKKCSTSLEIFQQLFGDRFSHEIKAHSIHEKQFEIQGYFGNRVPTKVHQYIYINNHYISPNHNLYKLVSSTLNNYSVKTDAQIRKGKDHPIFLISITWETCSSYELCYLEENEAYPILEDTLRRLIMRYLHVADGVQQPRELSAQMMKKQRQLKKSDSFIKHLESSSNLTANTLSSIDQNNQMINEYTPSMVDHSHLLGQSTTSGESVLPSMTSLSTPTSSPTPPSAISSNVGFHIPNKLQRQDLIPAKIIGQVDCKWIACLTNQYIVLIDQHAADERIKLENMLDSTLDIRFLEPNIYINVTKQEMELAMKYQSVLRRWGIHVEMSEPSKANHQRWQRQISPHFIKTTSPHFIADNNNKTSLLRVTRLPHLIIDRCTMFPNIISHIICDYLHALASNILSTSSCPPGIIEILKSLACRNAIMFNDPLTLKQCTQLIYLLSKTRFPFQCAHGRPSIVPLISLNHLQQNNRKRTIHWKNLDKL